VLLAQNVPAVTQDAGPGERVYKHSQVEVEQALQALQAYATNRLPVLDGFANANAGTLAKFENPHYQFRIDVELQGPAQTLVSITSKITAWAADADAAHSRYVVIPSNGRLEQDMLDRLSVYLEKGNAPQSREPREDFPKSSAAPVPSTAVAPGGTRDSSHADVVPGPATLARSRIPPIPPR
jgi:hypothetical protein